eukprot:525537-Pyramimonas_sp.AAC.1
MRRWNTSSCPRCIVQLPRPPFSMALNSARPSSTPSQGRRCTGPHYGLYRQFTAENNDYVELCT